MLAHPALMGPLSLILRAPGVTFTRLLGGGDVESYDAGAFICVALAAVLGVGLALGRPLGRLSHLPMVPMLLAVLLIVLNPATVAAVGFGHPEEVLTGALTVGAVALATRNRTLMAAIALGLALASKQWAILAVAPTILAVPTTSRVRVATVAGVTAAIFTLPFLVGNPDGFLTTLRHASNPDPGNVATPASWWFVVSKSLHLHFRLPPGYPSDLTVYSLPAWIVHGSHAFIVVLTAGLAVLIHRATRGQANPLIVLAIVFLLRCVLDPGNFVYYGVPLVLALLAWETLGAGRSLPVATLLTCTAIWCSFDVMLPHASAPATGFAYIGWTTVLLLYLIRQLRPAKREMAVTEACPPALPRTSRRRHLARL